MGRQRGRGGSHAAKGRRWNRTGAAATRTTASAYGPSALPSQLNNAPGNALRDYEVILDRRSDKWMRGMTRRRGTADEADGIHIRTLQHPDICGEFKSIILQH